MKLTFNTAYIRHIFGQCRTDEHTINPGLFILSLPLFVLVMPIVFLCSFETEEETK